MGNNCKDLSHIANHNEMEIFYDDDDDDCKISYVLPLHCIKFKSIIIIW